MAIYDWETQNTHVQKLNDKHLTCPFHFRGKITSGGFYVDDDDYDYNYYYYENSCDNDSKR